jgi:hypothetical protein
VARMSPRKQASDRSAQYDTTGMDPEMRQTLGQEVGRRARVRAATSPYASAVDRFGGMIRKLFPKKKGGK